ncbi:hypothetical protein DYI95_009550 [Thermaerobacter sp. PB12/4term]|uniref:hypothetical protein n=1 Tax=Thermaerobacter sp. PB12/4term TaxID=2293838 RepID=UPI000E32A9FA|nr:hypothetical protein [Thermaerobacter sp. PB12/4term]QIA27723.1 hypothetical protein DYI95_009550 [Thermaerobacter sp. PB12/4term]
MMDRVLVDLPGDPLWQMLGISLSTIMAYHLFLRARYLARLQALLRTRPGRGAGGEGAGTAATETTTAADAPGRARGGGHP